MRDRLQAILQLSAIPGLVPARLNGVFDALSASGTSLESLLYLRRDDLVRMVGLTSDQADAFHQAGQRAREVADLMQVGSLSVLTSMDDGWPGNLRRVDARVVTPWLFIVGDPSLLSRRMVGIAGSRDATARSLAITRELASMLARRDRVVVSGGARGVDHAAHDAALDAGGRTIVVLAQSVGTFRIPWSWRDPVRSGQLAIVSEYLPSDEWESFRAIQRNATIAQMSEALVVVQASLPSGTFSAGRAALKMRWPLHVVTQADPGAETFDGNRELVRLGGTPLVVPASHSVPPSTVDQILLSAPAPDARPAQFGLFS